MPAVGRPVAAVHRQSRAELHHNLRLPSRRDADPDPDAGVAALLPVPVAACRSAVGLPPRRADRIVEFAGQPATTVRGNSNPDAASATERKLRGMMVVAIDSTKPITIGPIAPSAASRLGLM